jgi:hypothetical protein
METEVEIQCLRQDIPMIESLLAVSSQLFKELIQKECKKTIECTIKINPDKCLDETDKDRYFDKLALEE